MHASRAPIQRALSARAGMLMVMALTDEYAKNITVQLSDGRTVPLEAPDGFEDLAWTVDGPFLEVRAFKADSKTWADGEKLAQFGPGWLGVWRG